MLFRSIVRNFTNFGIFVELEEGVDGLIHISDLSWSKKIKHPAEFTKIGEKIDVVVLEMDAESRRLSLGHKQLEENPWEIFETIYPVGSIHEGVVANQNDKGAVVNLQGVEGFAFNRGLQREDGTTIRQGDTEEFKIVEFSKEGKKIVLSHAKIWQDIKDAQREENEEGEKKKAKEGSKAAKKLSESLEKSTLGDLDALVSLNAELKLKESKSKKKATQEDSNVEIETSAEEPTKEEVIEPISEVAEVENKPKKTRAKKATKEEIPAEENEVKEEKPKKTRAKKVTKEESSTEEDKSTEE